METTVKLQNISYDDMENVTESIDNSEEFQISAFNDGNIGLWIENVDRGKICTIMCNLSKKDALLLGTALINLSESI